MKYLKNIVCLTMIFSSFQHGHANEGEVIYIFAGITRLDGWGDIAANALMASRLQRYRPESKVILYVPTYTPGPDPLAGDTPPSVPHVLKTLFPEYRKGSSMRLKNGLRVSSQIEGRPNYLIGFSLGVNQLRQISSAFELRARTSIFFDEPGGGIGFFDSSVESLDRTSLSFGGWSDFPRLGFTQRGSVDNGVRVYLSPGNIEGKGPGIYISPHAPAAPYDRAETLRMLKKTGKGRVPSGDVQIAFSYTSARGKEETEKFVEAFALLAADEENREKKIVLALRNFPNLKIVEIPKNLSLFRFDKMPFALSESLIGHADYPVQVTGDVSVSLALDYGKGIILDGTSWKDKPLHELMLQLVKNNDGVEDRLKKQMLQVTEKSGTGLHSTPKGKLSVMDIYEMLGESRYGELVSKHLEENRARLSMLHTLILLLDRIGEHPVPPNLEHIMDAVESVHSDAQKDSFRVHTPAPVNKACGGVVDRVAKFLKPR